jgi:hypothetical protein
MINQHFILSVWKVCCLNVNVQFYSLPGQDVRSYSTRFYMKLFSNVIPDTCQKKVTSCKHGHLERVRFFQLTSGKHSAHCPRKRRLSWLTEFSWFFSVYLKQIPGEYLARHQNRFLSSLSYFVVHDHPATTFYTQSFLVLSNKQLNVYIVFKILFHCFCLNHVHLVKVLTKFSFLLLLVFFVPSLSIYVSLLYCYRCTVHLQWMHKLLR